MVGMIFLLMWTCSITVHELRYQQDDAKRSNSGPPPHFTRTRTHLPYTLKPLLLLLNVLEMSSTSRIKELAASILSNTSAIDDYLISENLGSPSFNIDAPSKLQLPVDLTKLKTQILDATDELHTLLLGPVGFLTNFYVQHNSLVSLQAIEKFHIANAIPIDEEVTFAHIARQCNLKEDDTKRILRQAMTLHVFHEPRKGYVAHTSLSKPLAEDVAMRDYISFLCSECWRAAPRVVDAMVKWPISEEGSQTGWALANDSDESIIQELTKYPERLVRGPGFLQIMEQSEGLHPKHMIGGIDWTGVLNFVDVGGAHGSVSVEVVRRVPQVKCVVQDIPPVIASAKAPPDISGRLEFMPHDFFKPQPVKGADIYYLRWIIHNWSDKYAIRILQSLIPALKQGARVIANENLLPEPGSLSPYQERPMR